MPRPSGPARVLSALADRFPQRVREAVRRWTRSILVLLPTAARLPVVNVELRFWVPCWALRVVAVGLALGSAALVITGPFGWSVTAVLCVAILLRPAGIGAPALAVVAGFSMLQASDGEAWGVSGPLLLLALHACVTVCLLLGTTSWAAKVQLAVLGRPASRFVVIQLIAQLTGVAGALLSSRELSWPWVPVVAALALIVLAYAWLPKLGERGEPLDRADHGPRQNVRGDDATARRWGEE